MLRQLSGLHFVLSQNFWQFHAMYLACALPTVLDMTKEAFMPSKQLGRPWITAHQGSSSLDEAQRALSAHRRKGLPHLALNLQGDDARADALVYRWHIAGSAPCFYHAVDAVWPAHGGRSCQCGSGQ